MPTGIARLGITRVPILTLLGCVSGILALAAMGRRRRPQPELIAIFRRDVVNGDASDEGPGRELVSLQAWHRRRRMLVPAGAAISVAAIAAAGFGTASKRGLERRSGTPLRATARASNKSREGARRTTGVRITIASRPILTNVPRSFLGISTEYWSIPIWAQHLSLLDRVMSLLRIDGPLTLRIGGDSADQTFWSPVHELPEWTYELDDAWLRDARRIVNGAHVKVILDLNLVTATPQLAALWAHAAIKNLPRNSIAGFEVGNEPDIYLLGYWRKKLLRHSGLTELPERITPSSYAATFVRYSRALRRAAPGVPLLGPALAEPQKNLGWISSLLAGPHPGLRGLSAHRYPYSACSQPAAATHPTIHRVLSEHATAGMASTARRILRLSERVGLPLLLTEINSVTCGGLHGVSDSFATALWSADALFELLRAGVDAVDVHVRPHTINLAFALSRQGLLAHPLLYGMILFSRTLGPGGQLVQLRMTHPRNAGLLKAWAVRVRGNVLHVLLINKGGRSLQVSLRLPAASGSGTIQRLLGPHVASRSNVRLGGQQLDQQGRWRGRASHETIAATRHGYRLTVPRYSAALVALHLRAGALTGRTVRLHR